MSMSNITQKPSELLPAYERPVDLASIDQRMEDQLKWEAGSRSAPRDFSAEEQSDQSSSNKSRIGKKARTLGAVGLSAAVMIPIAGRAIDHEMDTGTPTPEHTGGSYNTGVDKDGNIIRIYPGSVNK